MSLTGCAAVVRSIPFEAALAETEGMRRHLLLGNGFSRALTDSFAYSSLYSIAGGFSPPVQALFDKHQPDFEAVLGEIARQRQAAPPEAWPELDRQRAEVRRAFVDAVAKVHPESAVSVPPDRKAACASFLKHFHDAKAPLGLRGKIFTTNYDLLLLWVLAASSRELKCYDDFVAEAGNEHFRPWDREKVADLVYLHGALHIYRHEGRLAMLRYREGARLVDQIRSRLARDEFPLFVAEGASSDKAVRIRDGGYLAKARSAFRGALNDERSVLFTVGHSLAEVDSHLFGGLRSRKLKGVYIGAYGGLASADGHRAGAWANRWAEDRANAGRPPLPVAVFDSAECRIWG